MRLTTENYKEGIASTSQGVLFCFSELCHDCKIMKKIIEMFSIQRRQAVLFKLDSAEEPQAIINLGIERVPTILIIHDGLVVAAKTGFITSRELTAIFDGFSTNISASPPREQMRKAT